MLRLTLISLSLLIVGLIIGVNIDPTPTAKISPMPTIVQQNGNNKQITSILEKITGLENKLAEETIAREKLQIKFDVARQEIKNLQLAIKETPATSSNLPDSEKKPENEEVSPVFQDISEAERNSKILLSIGMDDSTIQHIHALSEKKEMDQLYLRNSAEREGWFGTEKYFEKSRELDLSSNIYREQLGDTKYDKYLFASMQPNRITVQSVLQNSPAEEAGLLANDQILSYDDQRVFSWSELTSLTTDGESGQTVSINIVRANQRMDLFIPRGPIGIRLSSQRVDPDN